MVADTLSLTVTGLFVDTPVWASDVEEELLVLIVVVGAGSLGISWHSSEVEELDGDSVRDICLLQLLEGVAREVQGRHFVQVRYNVALSLDVAEEWTVDLRSEQTSNLGLWEHAVVVRNRCALDTRFGEFRPKRSLRFKLESILVDYLATDLLAQIDVEAGRHEIEALLGVLDDRDPGNFVQNFLDLHSHSLIFHADKVG